MSNVIYLFKEKDDVQSLLDEVSNMNSTEMVIICRHADGILRTRYTPVTDIFPYIGMLRVLEHDMLLASDENRGGV